MMPDLSPLDCWMREPEGERLEFKEAKTRYDFEELVKYCVALANEGGGKMILGVSDKPPRQVVGSEAFRDFERTKAGLAERIHLRVEAQVMNHPNGRVLIFDVPSRPIGAPIQYKGAYWMRAGESLNPLPWFGRSEEQTPRVGGLTAMKARARCWMNLRMCPY